jgi:hypothetical protein
MYAQIYIYTWQLYTRNDIFSTEKRYFWNSVWRSCHKLKSCYYTIMYKGLAWIINLVIGFIGYSLAVTTNNYNILNITAIMTHKIKSSNHTLNLLRLTSNSSSTILLKFLSSSSLQFSWRSQLPVPIRSNLTKSKFCYDRRFSRPVCLGIKHPSGA